MIRFLPCCFVFLVACNKSTNSSSVSITPVPPIQNVAQIGVYLSTGNTLKKLNVEDSLAYSDNTSSTTITIDTTVLYQSIDGFGAALTGSSAYNLKKYKSLSERNALYQDLFTKNGVGLQTIRISIGSSDFSTYLYSYDDMPAGQTDFLLTNFSIQKDMDTVFSVLKEIRAVNQGIAIIASPWSAPAWMKTNASMINGGSLKSECYGVYADYLVKYLQLMQQQNLTVEAITVQNEPRTTNAVYATMLMSPSEQISFIKTYLGPKMQAANLSTKIYCGDNNWNGFDYSASVLNDASVRQYIAGAAFHGYAGTATDMLNVQSTNTDKGIYFTEYTGVYTQPNYATNLVSFTKDYLINNVRNYAKLVLFWNLLLDQNSNPQIKGGSTCRGVFTVNSGTSTITKNEEYYALGQFAKFIKPNAKRISSTNAITDELYSAAFKNVDGGKVVVVLNASTSASKTFDTKIGTKKFTYTLLPSSVVTFCFN